MTVLDATPMPTGAPVPLLRTDDLPHPERLLRRGEIVKVRRGVYADAGAWHALSPWNRYTARVHAHALVRPGDVFSHESAAALLGMPVFGDPHTVHVLDLQRSAARAYSGARFHVTEDHREIRSIGGIMVTAPAETAVDLARARHPAIGLAMADGALRADDTITVARLASVNEGRTSSRGRRLARWPLARACARAETAIESISRAVIEWLGFPSPQLQERFPRDGVQGDRTDFFWPHLRLVGEADGDLKYDGRYGTARDAMRTRRERDARLMRHQVRAVAHWGWDDAVRIDPLRGILTGVGLRAVHPEHTANLASLRRFLAPR